MKSILVIEMPETCYGCPCMDDKWNSCDATGEELSENDADKKPSWCPLKPMPEKRTMYIRAKTDIEFAEYYARLGWNNCIEEIEK